MTYDNFATASASSDDGALDAAEDRFLAAWLAACRRGEVTAESIPHRIIALLTAMERRTALARIGA